MGVAFDGSGSYIQRPVVSPGRRDDVRGLGRVGECLCVLVRVFDFGDGPGSNEIDLAWNWTSGTMGLGVQDQDGNWTGIGTLNVFPQGQWVHVAVTIDSQGNAAIYWNGQEEGSGIVAVPPVLSRDHMYLGRSNWASDSPLTGAMHDVAIWSGARTADQISEDMNDPPTGSEPGLLAYYPLDGLWGLSVADRSPNHLDGTFVESRRGPNSLQSYPIVVTTADGRRSGWLYASTPNTAYRIEVFASATYGPGGTGMAQAFLGALEVTTDDSGEAIFDIPFAAPTDQPVVTATATDTDGNTSEISTRRQGVLDTPSQWIRISPGQPLVFSAATSESITLEDPEVGPLDPAWDLTLSVPLGNLALSTTAGLVGTGNGTGTLEYRGPLSEVNAALDALTYTPPAGFSGQVRMSIAGRSDGACAARCDRQDHGRDLSGHDDRR